MAKDFNHQFGIPTWQYDSIGRSNSQRPPDIGQENFTNSVFNAFRGSGNLPFQGFAAQKFCHLNSINNASGLASPRKNFLVFDRSADKTNFIFSSTNPGFLNPNLSNIIRDLPSKDDTTDQFQIHEDTEEIDALLYSDSYHVLDEEEASTGHSPFTFNIDDTYSCTPSKRRRIEEELENSALADTASSGLANNQYNCVPIPKNCVDEEGDASSCVKGGQLQRESSAGNSKESSLTGRKRARREKIRKTLQLLRGVMPSSKGKDAVTVLDEAIRYLKSFRLKAKAIGASYF